MLEHSVLPRPEQLLLADKDLTSLGTARTITIIFLPLALKLESSSHDTGEQRASNKSPKYWNENKMGFQQRLYFQTLIAATSSSDTAGAMLLPHFEGGEGSP